MESAAHFRAEATKCRALANHARDPMTIKNLLAWAEDYEAQAERLERTPDSGPPMPVQD
jgi:hypothetical protein